MPSFQSKFLSIPALLFNLMLPAYAMGQTCAPLPEQMRAARIHEAGGPEALRVESTAVPSVEAGDVLVRVHYASVNPVDWKLQLAGGLPFPATPGGDFAGEIMAVGSGVEGWKCGDRVAGIVNQRERSGSYAEYVSVPARDIVAAPAGLTLQEAAAYPTVAVAAWRYLIVAANVQAGERVLVHGGAGGVGSVVVQLAKARGAYVIATASARNHDYLKAIGADEVIDYRTTRFEDVVGDLDIVVDTVGGETLIRSGAVLRDGGRLVTLVGTVPADMCGRITCPKTPPWDVEQGLAGVAPVIAAGSLRIYIEGIYPLDAITAAQTHNQSGSTRGKVVVDMQSGSESVGPPKDVAGVRVTLQAYLDGHATGQLRHFQRAFTPDGWLVGMRNGRYQQRPVGEYINASANGQPPANEAQRKRLIRAIRVTGDVASAVVELDYPHMQAIDHMSLLRFSDGWRIVAKVYDARTPAEGAAGHADLRPAQAIH